MEDRPKHGPPLSPTQRKATAQYVNVARGRFRGNFMETRAAMERGHAGERGLVDLVAEAGKSWPIIWETFGKLRISSTERTKGNAVRLAMPRSGRPLRNIASRTAFP